MSNIDWKARAEAAESKLREIHEWLEQVPFVEKSKPAVSEAPRLIYGVRLSADYMLGFLSSRITEDSPITGAVWNEAVESAAEMAAKE